MDNIIYKKLKIYDVIDYSQKIYIMIKSFDVVKSYQSMSNKYSLFTYS